MSVFTEAELAYLGSARLGRLATVGPDGMPHVVPTSFRYNAERDTIDVGGHHFGARKKYRDALCHPKVAFVVDDIASVSPWRVRGIEVRGDVQVLGDRRQRAGARLRAADVPDHGPAHRELGSR